MLRSHFLSFSVGEKESSEEEKDSFGKDYETIHGENERREELNSTSKV